MERKKVKGYCMIRGAHGGLCCTSYIRSTNTCLKGKQPKKQENGSVLRPDDCKFE